MGGGTGGGRAGTCPGKAGEAAGEETKYALKLEVPGSRSLTEPQLCGKLTKTLSTAAAEL